MCILLRQRWDFGEGRGGPRRQWLEAQQRGMGYDVARTKAPWLPQGCIDNQPPVCGCSPSLGIAVCAICLLGGADSALLSPMSTGGMT